MGSVLGDERRVDEAYDDESKYQVGRDRGREGGLRDGGCGCLLGCWIVKAVGFDEGLRTWSKLLG